jgi:dihydroorotase
LYHSGKLTLEQVVKKLSINPRKILNLEVPQIEVGANANLTIIDLDFEWNVNVKKFQSRSKNSPFGGTKLKGKSVAVINNSQIFFDGEFTSI